MNKNITALITTFNPNETIKKNIEFISEQVNRVFICDNSYQFNDVLDNLPSNVIISSPHKNLGIPEAFNHVLKDNTNNWTDNEFIIFFDQDSEITSGYIDKLVNEYEKIEKIYPNLGCLGPIFYNTSNDRVESPRIKKELNAHTYSVNNIITSSLLTRYSNLKKVNFWNKNLFLDLADWDLCWRMISAGMLCSITDAIVLHHTVGIGEKKFGPLHVREGQPFREYYQTRDAYYLLQENYIPLKMRVRLHANLYLRPIMHKLFLPNWKERKLFIRQGREDFKNGIHGELK